MYTIILARRTAGAWTPQIRQSPCRATSTILNHKRLDVLFPASLNYPCQPSFYQAEYTTTSRLFSTLSTNDNSDRRGEWKVPLDLYIPEEKLEMSFVRSGGAGGQNVNKLSTQVQLKLLLDETNCNWIPAEVLQRLKDQQRHRINKQNELTIHMQEYRTQLQNRKAAIDKMREFILEAWPRPKVRKLRTGVSKHTKERYREEKLMQSKKKENRGKVDF